MGWFSRKASHEQQVAAMTRVVVNMFEKVVAPDRLAQSGLQLRLPDSRFRFLMFSVAAVHAVCARHMSNPDAILNECGPNLIRGALSDKDSFFDGPVEAQEAATLGMNCIGDFLDRWSAYIDIAKGGNAHAATSIVVTMLHETETVAPPAGGDAARLLKLARWVEVLMERNGAIDRGFLELTG